MFPLKEELCTVVNPTAAMAGPLLDARLETKEELRMVVLPPSRSAPPTSDRSKVRAKYVETSDTGGMEKNL